MPHRAQRFQELCFACGEFYERRCYRCDRFACQEHGGDDVARRCIACEDEYRHKYRDQGAFYLGRWLVALGLLAATSAVFFPGRAYAWGAIPLVLGVVTMLVGVWCLDRANTPRERFLMEKGSIAGQRAETPAWVAEDIRRFC